MRRSEELDLARQLEDLEVTAWQIVLETPGLRGHEAVKAVVAKVVEIIREADATVEIDPARLRRADGDRRYLDQIVAVARRSKAADQLETLAASAQVIRHQFVMSNLGLVGMLVKKFLWSGLTAEDLMQEGTLGLMHAIGGFDYRRGLRFSTYAMWWIRHSLGRSCQNSAEVRLPVHIQDMNSRVSTKTRDLKKELGREPLEQEIATAVGVSIEKFRTIGGPGYWITGAPKSLDQETVEGLTLGDKFADPATVEETTLDKLIVEEETYSIRTALDQLARKHTVDADVLRRRFGIDRASQRLSEIGEEYGLSRERIRQIEMRALERLRGILDESGADGTGEAGEAIEVVRSKPGRKPKFIGVVSVQRDVG